MADGFDYDCFLSHNSGDKPRVRRLAERLREAGLRVWLDDWVIRPGDDIYLAVERGLADSRVQVLCLSPAALGSNWVSLERSTVLFRDPTNTARRFVPLLLADCDLPDTLRRYRYLDFREESEVAFQELIAACRAEGDAAAPVPNPKRKKSPPKPRPGAAQAESAEPLAVLGRKLVGHKDWVKSLAVSPDGTWAASGSDDETVKIWDLNTGRCRATLKGAKDGYTSVAITPDGKRVLSGSLDESICVWDAISGSDLGQLEGHTAGICSVAALHETSRALSGGLDETLHLWDLSSGLTVRMIKVDPMSRTVWPRV